MVTLNEQQSKGVLYTAASFTLWGLFPLYWKLMEHISSGEILAHRILWSFVFMCGILLYLKQVRPAMQTVKGLILDGKAFFSLLLSAILISVNWYVYIWAVNHGLMLEASLGYYINPLVSVLLGIIFLKERLNKWQTIAILIAAFGVILSTVQYGSFPVVAFLLALSFGFYGLIKKRMSFTSAIGLTIETLLLAPAALVYLLFFLKEPVVTMNPNSFGSLGLLFFAGVFTAVPLLLFSEGAKRIPLYQVGILQYIAPTITLFLGLFVYHEHLTAAKIVTFLCIWVAILLFTTSQLRMKKTANSH
ncbi:EamA family transporter RarD [Bacillus safensis]|uniref:EamA family transporter RarD n=1 Tax=Bacillus safensis TaxID=561879 RepID=UPI0022380B45|nr:EamA family transporter RarD [Bacillus safensis]MCW4643753.1 EamA family transporter RarD [Bacillus safensis]MCY7564041.1 EamA family transporter RarD [Bacillus safensis]MCY7626861.1 EamA family transporter RarD [Bacillus safensis]MCY7633470.1 EamA family transporter RarD [Bacillus safensis]MCY7647989.1 EamA family transporter RarD [Bacillus safensis]